MRAHLCFHVSFIASVVGRRPIIMTVGIRVCWSLVILFIVTIQMKFFGTNILNLEF